MKSTSLNVREIETKDILLIADYWLNADADFLIGMGVDLKKVPSRDSLIKMLSKQVNNQLEKKMSYALIWEFNNQQIGHTNINNIVFGDHATMHLHLWNNANRQKGIGTKLVKKSLPFYFENFQLKTLFCEPYALNPAPNKTLRKVGFEFDKKYTTIPGSLNFEQEVNRWKLSKLKYKKLI